MPTDLNKLKLFLPPVTVGEVRRARLAAEHEPDEPGFLPALEEEMHDELLACAHAVAREQAAKEARHLALQPGLPGDSALAGP